MVLCPNCNTENEKNAKFCGHCGAELDNANEENETPTQDLNENKEIINDKKQSQQIQVDKVSPKNEKQDLIEKIKLRLLYKNYHKNVNEKEISKSKSIALIFSFLWFLLMCIVYADNIMVLFLFGGITSVGLGTTIYIIGLFIRYFIE